MKRAISLLFLCSIFVAGSCQQEDDEPVQVHIVANDYLLKIVKNYFRSDPYTNEFGQFLRHLVNDPMLASKAMRKRTDSTLFYFQGQYKNFSPFSFLADRTEIRFAEKEFVLDDSLATRDTLYVYQLLGYNNGKVGLEAVKEEFSKFHRRYAKHFITDTSSIRDGSEILGQTENYFIPMLPTSPLSASWAKLDDLANAFIITIRLKNN